MPQDEGDEEDGRFFGGGLTEQQQQILEILDRDTGEGSTQVSQRAVLDQALGKICSLAHNPSALPVIQPPPPPPPPPHGLHNPRPNTTATKHTHTHGKASELRDFRKQLLRLERAISKNQEQRMKHANAPARFIESEAALDAEVRALVVMTTRPGALYGEALRHALPASLCALLSHENEDVASSVVQLLEELTDEDVLEGIEEAEEEEEEGQGQEQDGQGGNSREKAEEALRSLVDALVSRTLLGAYGLCTVPSVQLATHATSPPPPPPPPPHRSKTNSSTSSSATSTASSRLRRSTPRPRPLRR